MTIKERISRDEWCLYELIRHPVLFGEFYRNLDTREEIETFEYTSYQKEYLCDFNSFVSLCCGRAVGKTLSLTDYILWLLINNLHKNEYIMYTVPNKVHLEPVFSNLIKYLRSNSLLRNFIEPKRGINSSNFTITLLNNSQLICRIAGQSGTGANVVGHHTPIIILDEGGYYPWGTWIELQPVLNNWEVGHKLWVAGVPTGIRENNVLYFTDEVSDNYSKHRTSCLQNPRYSTQDDEENRRKYGGIDSEDYIHLVTGRHGSPTFAVFDRRLMKIESNPTYTVSISGVDIKNSSEIISRLALLPSMPKHTIGIMGIDLGYTEPTSILLLYEKNGFIYEHCRITLTKVQYPHQEKVIDFLDGKFMPDVIGIDVGNEKGVTQHLLEDDIYLHKNYKRRVYPVSFGAWLELGENSDGEMIKTKVKPFSVSLLQEKTNAQQIVYSSTDLDLVTELERMTYTKSPTGEVVYKTLTPKGGKRGDDHNTSALLCGILAYYVLQEGKLFTKKKEPIVFSRWVTF